MIFQKEARKLFQAHWNRRQRRAQYFILMKLLKKDIHARVCPTTQEIKLFHGVEMTPLTLPCTALVALPCPYLCPALPHPALPLPLPCPCTAPALPVPCPCPGECVTKLRYTWVELSCFYVSLACVCASANFFSLRNENKRFFPLVAVALPCTSALLCIYPTSALPLHWPALPCHAPSSALHCPAPALPFPCLALPLPCPCPTCALHLYCHVGAWQCRAGQGRAGAGQR